MLFLLGIPHGMINGCSFDGPIEFLGHIITPSGIPADNNAYILNLQTPTGGYIDGMALAIMDGISKTVHVSKSTNDCAYTPRTIRSLDENPSCRAHLVNHSKARSNVEIIPFSWVDVAPSMDDILDHQSMFDLPNVIRQDGAPRYFLNSEIVYYATTTDTATSSSRIGNVCGAVLCATKDIEQDRELFLDYGLELPLPPWAAHWYENAQ
jgi:hypothetical protein